MAALKSKSKQPKNLKTIKHDEAKRKSIPMEKYQSVMAENGKGSMQVAYERRNKEMNPQVMCQEKDEQDWSNLVISASPLYIQKKVHPKVLVNNLSWQHQALVATSRERSQ